MLRAGWTFSRSVLAERRCREWLIPLAHQKRLPERAIVERFPGRDQVAGGGEAREQPSLKAGPERGECRVGGRVVAAVAVVGKALPEQDERVGGIKPRLAG